MGKYQTTQRKNGYSLKKNHQTNTLIYFTDTDSKLMDTTPIEAENRKITDSQRQALDKGIKWQNLSKVR